MRDDIDDKIREKVPAELRNRVIAKVGPALDRNREREGAGEGAGFWGWLLRPMPLGTLAGACAAAAVVVYVQRAAPQGDATAVAASPVQYDAEMLAEAELLQDLDVLDHWETLKKSPEWKKKKI